MGLYIVTGGFGFIGGHLVDKLISLGHKVIVADSLFSGKIKNLRKHISNDVWEDIKNLNVNSEFKRYELSENLIFFKCDIRDFESLRKVFSSVGNVDFVFNLAAIVSVPYSMKNEEETMDVNYRAVKNVVELAKEFGVKGIVHAGSSAEYGDCEEIPLREEFANDSVKQLSPYGKSKYLATKFLLDNCSDNFRTVVLRFFNVYGSRQDPSSPYSGVISKFFDLTKSEDNLNIFGDGSQTRDFIHVSDIVNALTLSSGIALSRFEEKKLGNDSFVFNVGGGESVSVKELAESIIKISGKQVSINYLDPREGDILHSCANIEKISNILGWKQLMSLEEGLKSTYSWYS